VFANSLRGSRGWNKKIMARAILIWSYYSEMGVLFQSGILLKNVDGIGFQSEEVGCSC
jgi:hypothetical protein